MLRVSSPGRESVLPLACSASRFPSSRPVGLRGLVEVVVDELIHFFSFITRDDGRSRA